MQRQGSINGPSKEQQIQDEFDVPETVKSGSSTPPGSGGKDKKVK